MVFLCILCNVKMKDWCDIIQSVSERRGDDRGGDGGFNRAGRLSQKIML